MKRPLVQLRSTEVNEILTDPPRWIIRRGVMLVLALLVLAITASFLIWYPDIITARVTVLTESPSITVVAEVNGNVAELFKKNGDLVKKGEVIALVESPTSYAHVTEIKSIFLEHLAKLEDVDSEVSLPLDPGAGYQLGVLQEFYATAVTAWQEYERFFEFDFLNQKKVTLNKHLRDYETYHQLKRSQLTVVKRELSLARGLFRRDSILFRRGAMAEMEYEISNARYLGQVQQYRSAQADLSNITIQLNQIRQQIMEVDIQRSESAAKLKANCLHGTRTLLTQIRIWEQRYVLVAPIDGNVALTNLFNNGQHILAGLNLFTVVPVSEGRIIGRILVPISGAGKVKKGQRVNIKLDNYPHQEFGFLSARIESISQVPLTIDGGTFYSTIVFFPGGFNSTYRQKLPFGQEMQGTAEIVTDDKRLIERLVAPIISVVRKGTKSRF